MIRLILVRHGNTFESNETPTIVGARSDLPLTAQGCEQARQFARYLLSNNICPKTIYAGGLKRQIETATIISEHVSSLVQCYEPALTEIDYGAWEGLTQEEILNHWQQEYHHWTTKAEWAHGVFGRNLEDHICDINNWLKNIRTSHGPGDTVVAVTSNGIIRFFYSLQEKGWEFYVEKREVEKLKVKTGHFCELHVNSSLIEIKSWNIKP